MCDGFFLFVSLWVDSCRVYTPEKYGTWNLKKMVDFRSWWPLAMYFPEKTYIMGELRWWWGGAHPSSSQFVREIFAPYSEEEHGNSARHGRDRGGYWPRFSVRRAWRVDGFWFQWSCGANVSKQLHDINSWWQLQGICFNNKKHKLQDIWRNDTFDVIVQIACHHWSLYQVDWQ